MLSSTVSHDTRIFDCILFTAGFPLGLEKLENLEKWEGIFQSGKSLGILNRLEKSGKITQNAGKLWEFQKKKLFVITVHNEVAKVMFLHLSVILFTGRGVVPQCMLGYHPPEAHTPLEAHPPEAHPLWEAPPRRHAPWEAHTPRRHFPQEAHTQPWEASPRKHTPPWEAHCPQEMATGVQTVHILLECILVLVIFK